MKLTPILPMTELLPQEIERQKRTFLKFLNKQEQTWQALPTTDAAKKTTKGWNWNGEYDAGEFKTIERRGMDIFVAINETNGKLSNETIVNIRAFWIDSDGAFDIYNRGDFPLAPSVIIARDATHCHAYWFLRRGVSTVSLNQFRNGQKALTAFFNSDPSINNPARIMRVPGFQYSKSGKEVSTYQIIGGTGKRYTPEQIYEAFDLDPEALQMEPDEARKINRNRVHDYSETDTENNINKYIDYLDRQSELREGTRSHGFFRLLAMGRDLGLPPETRMDIMIDFNRKKVFPPAPIADIERINDNVERYAKDAPGNRTGGDDFEVLEERPDDGERPKKSDEPDPFDTISDSWVWVSAIEKFKHIETGRELSPTAFDMEYSRYTPTSGNNRKTAMQYIKLSDRMRMVERLVYRPMEYVSFDPYRDRLLPGSESYLYNMYEPSELRPMEGNQLWIDSLMEYMFPEKTDRNYFLDYLSFIVQRPGEKTNFALIVQSNTQGIGKSYIGHLMRYILGPRNVAVPSNDMLADKWTGWMSTSQLIIVEELMQTGRLELMNRLKTWITAPYYYMERKGRDPIEMENFFNIIGFTNHRDALKLEDDDRRFLVISSPAKKILDPVESDRFWGPLWGTTKTRESVLQQRAAEFFHYLLNRRIKLDVKGRAPETTGKRHMIEANRTTLEAWVLDRMGENGDGAHWPFLCDIVSLSDIECNAQFPAEFRRGNRHGQSLQSILSKYGGGPIHARVPVNGKKRRLWACRNYEKWEGIGTGAIAKEFLRGHSETDNATEPDGHWETEETRIVDF